MRLQLMNYHSKIFKFNIEHKSFELKINDDKIILINKNLELGTLNFEKSLNNVLIEKIDFNYKLNNINVILIKLNNEICIQIGRIGVSMYKSYEEFLKNTKVNYSKNVDSFLLIPFNKY